MNSIEEYRNAIEMLKQALSFYANPDNYKQNHAVNHELFSYVEMDGGVQANFALNKLSDLENLSKNMEDEFVKNLTGAIENNEETHKLLQMIEDFKKISEIEDNSEADDNKIQ